MSYHHDIGAFEDTVERRDELFLSRSIHCKLFPVGGPSSMREPPVATSRPSLALRRTLHKSRQDDAPQNNPAPRARTCRTGFSRFEPVAGLTAPKRSSPSVQVSDIKPDSS